MKKILSFTLTIISIFILTGCFGSRVAITSSEFKNNLETNGYSVSIAMSSEFENEFVTEKLIAKKGSDEIRFYVMSEIDKAVIQYSNFETEFANSKGGTAYESGIEGPNYKVYNLTTNGKYKKISRVDNTIIYLNVAESNKDSVETMITNIGY